MDRYFSSIENPHLGGNMEAGDPSTFSPQSWDYLIDRFALTSMLDVGSGLGHCARYFYKRGVYAIAMDGLELNIRKSLYPAVLCDLTISPFTTNVDLVHCQEVVEHIEPQYLDNIIKTFQSGRIVCMSHAMPGQGGYHHVNEQPSEYWIEAMKERGFELLDLDTTRIRYLAKRDGAIYLEKSALVFANIN